MDHHVGALKDSTHDVIPRRLLLSLRQAQRSHVSKASIDVEYMIRCTRYLLQDTMQCLICTFKQNAWYSSIWIQTCSVFIMQKVLPMFQLPDQVWRWRVGNQRIDRWSVLISPFTWGIAWNYCGLSRPLYQRVLGIWDQPWPAKNKSCKVAVVTYHAPAEWQNTM